MRSMRPNRTLHTGGRTEPDSILGLGLSCRQLKLKWQQMEQRCRQTPPSSISTRRALASLLTSHQLAKELRAKHHTTQQGVCYVSTKVWRRPDGIIQKIKKTNTALRRKMLAIKQGRVEEDTEESNETCP